MTTCVTLPHQNTTSSPNTTSLNTACFSQPLTNPSPPSDGGNRASDSDAQLAMILIRLTGEPSDLRESARLGGVQRRVFREGGREEILVVCLHDPQITPDEDQLFRHLLLVV